MTRDSQDAPGNRLPQFAALRHRGFRLLWVATLLSSTARWADLVVIGWLTLKLTDSAFMVGAVAASKMAAYFVAPFAGVLADRLDRRLLLLVASVMNLAVSIALPLLFVLDALALWHLIALAMVSSLTWAIDHPTRQALVPDLVGGAHLANAVALNAVAVEITVVVGPAIGGTLIPVLGIAGAYVLIAAIYAVDVVVLVMLGSVSRAGARAHEPPLRSLRAGLRYALSHRTVLVLLAIALLLNLFAAPYRYAFMPVFARDVLDAGPAAFGMLTAMAGVGALVAGLWMVSLGDVRRKGRLLVWSMLVWPFALLLFAASASYALSLVLVFVAGLAQAIAWTTIATLILMHTAQEMRGRIMGLRAGVVASLPVGNFLGGVLAERAGAPLAQGLYALLALAIMLAMALRMPALYRLK